MKYLSLIALLFILSCDRPECRNTNPIFDKYPLSSKEYRTELVKQLMNKKEGELRYWMEDVEERNGRKYLVMYMQGNGLCAKGLMDITDWQHMQTLRPGNMQGYAGAELEGLSYNINTDSSGPWLGYINVERIVD